MRDWLVVVLVMGAIVVAPLLILPGDEIVEARITAIGPRVIAGYVYMPGGSTPAVGATVIATIWNGTSLRATIPTTSDSTGFYTVTFAPTDWDVGNLIVVGATLGLDFGEANAIADSSPLQYIDVTLGGAAIPELGVPAALMVSAVGMIVIIACRRGLA